MTGNWDSLCIRGRDHVQVAIILRDTLLAAGYQRYDPFPGGSGTPPGLKTFVKQFVAPAQDGWVRVLGAPDVAVLPALSVDDDVLHAQLSVEFGDITVYHNGALDPDYLSTYLRPGKTLDDLARAR